MERKREREGLPCSVGELSPRLPNGSKVGVALGNTRVFLPISLLGLLVPDETGRRRQEGPRTVTLRRRVVVHEESVYTLEEGVSVDRRPLVGEALGPEALLRTTTLDADTVVGVVEVGPRLRRLTSGRPRRIFRRRRP